MTLFETLYKTLPN